MSAIQRFSDLSAPRQFLVRLCQSINFGQIEHLAVRNAEPVFEPPPVVLVDVKLNGDEGPRPELELADYALCGEIRHLTSWLDKIRNGNISRIEVRAGIARRIIFVSELPQR